MKNNVPRPEHPLPQWERPCWKNLNGEWEFEFDFGKSALERGVIGKEKLDRTITVPFCPESVLSGIGYTDFIPAVCYRRSFTLTTEEATSRVVLHFGAVDYKTLVFVNGKRIGTHIGGYTSFSFDITGAVTEGENTVFLYVEDDVRSGKQPGGKQSSRYASHGCDYTRTTGIWQTVWLEFTPHTYIKNAKYYPDINNKLLTVVAEVKGSGTLRATARYEGRLMGEVAATTTGGATVLQLPLSELHLWEAGEGRLYDLTLTFGEDAVSSYFGMRSTRYEGKKWLLNGRSVFMRLVLDQGFYQDGIYTAPDEEALKKDIELSMAAGFNGARLHEKVFEARFLYHADKMGYLVFGEYPNWRLDHHLPEAAAIYMNEWQEAVERDFNSPAVIGWCPLNETWGYHEEQATNRLISSVYYLTKRLDPTRPCIDVSGNFHVTPEVYDIHDYDQNTATFRARWEKFSCVANAQRNVLEANDPFFRDPAVTHQNRHGSVPFFSQPYHGEPIFVSEYGGIQWNTNGNSGWGYGVAPKNEREFIERYRGLTAALLDNPDISGFCYTQLYDIEQEINGLYTYAREPKFSIDVFREINQAKAAIED